MEDVHLTLIAERIADMFEALLALGANFDLPPWFNSILTFAGKNISRQRQTEEPFNKVKTRIIFNTNRVTKLTIVLIWIAHNIGRYVNRYRFDHDLPPVDFYKEAIEYDKRQNANVQAELAKITSEVE